MAPERGRPGAAENDLTPLVGAETDVAPVGRGTKPSHELTAAEEADIVDWERLAASDEFKSLVSAKLRFIVPATIFFVVYYFALPLLVGYAPEFMSRKVIGPINLAYLFALSQFFVAWIIAALYVRVAAGWDRRAAQIVDRGRGER